MCGMTLRLSERKSKEGRRLKQAERRQPPHLAAGCYSLKELHLRAFLLIKSLSFRGPLDPPLGLVDSPWLCPCMPALPEIPATSCSLGGRRGKNAMAALAISSCW